MLAICASNKIRKLYKKKVQLNLIAETMISLFDHKQSQSNFNKEMFNASNILLEIRKECFVLPEVYFVKKRNIISSGSLLYHPKRIFIKKTIRCYLKYTKKWTPKKDKYVPRYIKPIKLYKKYNQVFKDDGQITSKEVGVIRSCSLNIKQFKREKNVVYKCPCKGCCFMYKRKIKNTLHNFIPQLAIIKESIEESISEDEPQKVILE